MYPPHYLGGHELVWRAANAHLRGAGHEVRVLASDYRRPGLPAGREEEPDVHRELHWYWRDHAFPRLSPPQRLALERHNMRVLRRHLRELRPDAVCWWSLGGMSLSLVEHVRRAGVPAVGVVGDDWMLYGPEVDAWTRFFARRPALAPLAERLTGIPARPDPGPAALWLFVSEFLRRRALERFELPRTAVAHPGIDPDLFSPAPAKPWGWRLVYVGRIDPRKGIELALRALVELPEEATLAVVGAGDEAHLAALHELVRELGIERRVRFDRRPRAELRDEYAAADVLVFPALWEEPWGLVPLEAMAVGTPVVATRRGGSAEYLAPGENCVAFDADGGPPALAAAVHTLAADGALRARLREGGMRTARAHHERHLNEALLAALERAQPHTVRR